MLFRSEEFDAMGADCLAKQKNDPHEPWNFDVGKVVEVFARFTRTYVAALLDGSEAFQVDKKTREAEETTYLEQMPQPDIRIMDTSLIRKGDPVYENMKQYIKAQDIIYGKMEGWPLWGPLKKHYDVEKMSYQEMLLLAACRIIMSPKTLEEQQ